MIRQRKCRQSKNRRGGTTLVVLVCLSVLALVAASLLRETLIRRDQIEADHRRFQADWLVEAGLERAAAQLAADPSYPGETWDIPAEALGGRPAVVAIEVQPIEDEDGPDANARTVHVRADYPSDGDSSDRARRTKTIVIRPGAGFSGGES